MSITSRNGAKTPKPHNRASFHGLAPRMPVWRHEGQPEFSQRSQCLKHLTMRKAPVRWFVADLPVRPVELLPIGPPSKMMRRRITLRNSWRDGYKSDRHQSARRCSIELSSPDGIRRNHIDGGSYYERRGGCRDCRRNIRRRRRHLATCGLPDPAICLPKSGTVLCYRPCDIYERFDVGVFARSFTGVACPIAVDRLECGHVRQPEPC
jgi:hypothetical protein